MYKIVRFLDIRRTPNYFRRTIVRPFVHSSVFSSSIRKEIINILSRFCNSCLKFAFKILVIIAQSLLCRKDCISLTWFLFAEKIGSNFSRFCHMIQFNVSECIYVGQRSGARKLVSTISG